VGLLWGHAARISGPHEFVLISAIPYTVWLISACAPRLCSFGPGPGVPKGIWIMAKAEADGIVLKPPTRSAGF